MALGVSESRFYMWRAVVAMVHADGVVTPHELAFIQDYINDINLSEGQLGVIAQDLQTPQDVYEMFAHIKDVSDKKDFFTLARALSWCDGDFARQERHIIKCLEASHLDNETRDILSETRDVINEIELDTNQWHSQSTRSEGVFEFFTKFKESLAS